MIKNVFKLNGKPINVYTSWDDFTFEQYERILDLKDDDVPEVVSILTGVDRETLEKAEIKGLENLLGAANFLKTVPTWPLVTDKIGPYTIPANKNGKFEIQFESLGQFEDMRKAMAKCTAIVDLTKTYPLFVAIYLQKLSDGIYSYSKAVDMVPSIRRMPAREVMALGSFFYARLRSLLTGTPDNSHSPTPSQKKLKLDSKNSMKDSGRMPR